MPKPFLPTVLETARITLRFIEERDVDAIYAVYSDPLVARYLSKPAQTERAQAEKMVANVLAGYADGSSVTFAMERREDGVVIGIVMLFRFNDESRRAEIGYSMGQAHWGRGYMDECLRTVIDYGFGPLGLNRVEADIDPRNAASAKSLARLGFKAEGVLRERWIVAGEVSDTAYYGLLRSDWMRPAN
jgi:[ribosomal protein S5]-alanine N-acetyltransferase